MISVFPKVTNIVEFYQKCDVKKMNRELFDMELFLSRSMDKLIIKII